MIYAPCKFFRKSLTRVKRCNLGQKSEKSEAEGEQNSDAQTRVNRLPLDLPWLQLFLSFFKPHSLKVPIIYCGRNPWEREREKEREKRVIAIS